MCGKKNRGGGGQSKYFYEGHEYLVIFAKNKLICGGLFKHKDKSAVINDFIRKIHGKYTNNPKIQSILGKYPNQLINHRNLMFEELDIFLQEKMITQEKYDEIHEKLNSGEYFLQKYNDKFSLICKYNTENISLMYSIILGVFNSEASNELIEIFGENGVFDNPKPVRFLKEFLEKNLPKNSIILDSFAGSGTTAHAVLELNKKDGGNRKFILVEMEDYAENITAERVKRVIKGYGKELENSATGGDFSFYELGDRLLEENGNLNEKVSIEKIREYIYFSETKEKCEQNDSDFLGECNGVTYYFIYKKDDITTLDFEYLAKLKKASNYVIYADVCVLSNETMMKYNITFKKIPRDIKKV